MMSVVQKHSVTRSRRAATDKGLSAEQKAASHLLSVQSSPLLSASEFEGASQSTPLCVLRVLTRRCASSRRASVVKKLILLLPLLALPACSDPTTDDQAPDDTAFNGVWTCPMCPGVASPTPALCPKCSMHLIGTRTELTWQCLAHPVIVRGDEGLCPICERALKPVAMAVVFRCADHEDVRELAAGACPRCDFPLEESLEALPHGDHNPRHGGQFFMAPDNWHHLEGAMPSPGELRVHIYDDFTRPLPADRASGRVELGGDGEDDALRIALGPSSGGEYLVATLPAELAAFPVEVTAFIEFTRSPGEEHRFDFRFEAPSVEEGARAGAIEAIAQERGAPDTAPEDLSGFSSAELVERLGKEADEVARLIGERSWEKLYAPAMAAKDVALELGRDARLRELGGARRDLERAVRDVVRGAWLIELHGDAGNGERVGESRVVFDRGVAVLRSAGSTTR